MQEETKRKKFKKPRDFSLQDLIRVILVRKWLILLILLTFTVASFYYVKTTPPVYQSQVIMMREPISQTLSANVVESPVEYQVFEFDRSQELLLKSSSLLAEAKQQLLEKHNIEVSVEQLKGGLSLSPAYEDNPNIIRLTATAGAPEQARAMADVAADAYIIKTAETKRAELDQGIEFLRQQIAQVEKKIEETEKALNDFRDKEGLVPIAEEASSGGLLGKLGAMQDEALKTESDIELTKSQLQTLEKLILEKKKYAQSSSVTGLSYEIDQLRERLINLKLELNTKLETLTEKDPEVIAIVRKIDVTQKQLKAEFDKLLEGPSTTSFDPISELQSLMQQLITQTVELERLQKKAILIKGRISKFRADHPELASKQVELIRLERQSRVYEQAYATLTSKYQDMQLLGQMKSAEIKVIESANLPGAPIAPKKKQTLTIGVLFGLLLGITASFFLEYLDYSIKTKEDVEHFLELPVMGMIPKIEPFDIPEKALKSNFLMVKSDYPSKPRNPRSKPRRGHNRKIQQIISRSLLYAPSKHKKDNPIESYRSLAMNIRYASVDNPIKSILVTSSVPQEGKTITASNLAIVMAQSGIKVLLMDADLRRPRMHRIFQQDRTPGLADLLVSDSGNGDITPDSVSNGFINFTTVENLYLLPAGFHIANVSALLTSERMRKLMENLVRQYDMVILDSPPLLSVSDAVVLGNLVDGTLIVIQSEKTDRKVVLQAKEILENLNAEIIGTVLNNIDYKKQYGYYYYYRRYYYRYYSESDEDDSE